MKRRPADNTALKIGFMTDTHFSVVRRGFRTDDYFESVLSKFRQCYQHMYEAGCELVIHGGDMFDKYCSYSHRMMLAVREVILSTPLKTYVIWGQHDLLGYNRESGRNSNLAFLIKVCNGQLIEIPDMIETEKARLFASHVDQTPSEVLASISQRYRKPSICVVHALLYDRPSSFDTIDVHTLLPNGADLVLSGDLHCGYPPVKIGQTTYYNPGALARTSRENRLPRCAVITLTPFMGSWDCQIDEFLPQCEQYPFPPQEEGGAKVSDEMDSNTYIEAFERLKSESRDIYERLEKVGREGGVEERVLEYIKSKRGS